MDRIFHHVLWYVAQIQLVLGLRRLEAQLWQGKEYQAAASQAATISCSAKLVSNLDALVCYIPSCLGTRAFQSDEALALTCLQPLSS